MSRITRIIPGIALLLGILCFVPVAPAALAGEPAWVLVESDPAHSDFFYDKSAISALPDDIVAVRVQVVYHAEGKAETLKMLNDAKKYGDLAASEYRYEIMCGEARKSRLQQVIHYDGKRGRIAEFNLAGKTEWQDIPVASRLDDLADEVCKK